jgi:hypothetical protein
VGGNFSLASYFSMRKISPPSHLASEKFSYVFNFTKRNLSFSSYFCRRKPFPYFILEKEELFPCCILR